MSITICNFSSVYGNQPYLEGLRLSGKASWLDLSGVSGTDCYCDDEAVETIRSRIAEAGITDACGLHFFDNGNYHYMSKIWTDMIQEPITLVVFDHHPDMQEPRFGDILSCGGWVKKVLDENKYIEHVILIGVADHLVDEIPPHEKVSFIRESELPSVTQNSIAALRLQNEAALYISIDKDVLAPDHAATNWDQGSLSLEQMKNIISAFAQGRKILGVDICGERAHDFTGDEQHTVQEADALNNELNRDLITFWDSIGYS